MSEYKELSCLAYDLRKKVVEMVVSGKGGHIGGDMSVIDGHRKILQIRQPVHRPSEQ